MGCTDGSWGGRALEVLPETVLQNLALFCPNVEIIIDAIDIHNLLRAVKLHRDWFEDLEVHFYLLTLYLKIDIINFTDLILV